MLATAIKGGLSVFDSPELELTYAPPFSSAKDPVNMLDYVAQNMLEGDLKTIQWHKIDELAESRACVLDVREPKEWDAGYIPDAFHIPLDQLRDRLTALAAEETIYVYCHTGLRGYLATRVLQENGFEVKNLDGGYKTYSVAMVKRRQTKRLIPESIS